MRSPNQYAEPFMTTATPRAISMPESPAKTRPTSTRRTVIRTIQNAVFS
jgi:hypothetical protein